PIALNKKNVISYPSFDVRDEHADEIRDERECEVGTDGEAKIKFRLTGNSKDDYSNRLTFDMLEMNITSYGKEDKKDKDEDEDKDDAGGYDRPKSDKESPPISATDLEE